MSFFGGEAFIAVGLEKLTCFFTSFGQGGGGINFGRVTGGAGGGGGGGGGNNFIDDFNLRAPERPFGGGVASSSFVFTGFSGLLTVIRVLAGTAGGGFGIPAAGRRTAIFLYTASRLTMLGNTRDLGLSRIYHIYVAHDASMKCFSTN